MRLTKWYVCTDIWYICTNMALTARAESPRPRGTKRRDALLEAVLQIVSETGADAVTHRRVAAVAGLPLASTTYWFRSKEDLLTAALELAAERDITRLQAFVARPVDDSVDPASLAVDAIVQSLDELDRGNRGSLLATYTLVFEAARRPALREVTSRWTEVYLRAVAGLLEASGSKHPCADAELLLAAADGLLIGQLASGERTELGPRLRRLACALVMSP
jgi:DNA-binding transcriptional regulator YbjK